MINQAVIIAGGRGTRLAPFTDTQPKPMYPIAGKPFIDRLIAQIRGFGISRIVLLLGYLPEVIMEYLGDGRRYDATFYYDITPEHYETGDRIIHAKELLDEEFLFMYCDNYCPIDYEKLVSDYYNNSAKIQLTAYKNADSYTKNNLLIDRTDNRVICYDKKRQRTDTYGVDIGYAIINKSVLDYITDSGKNFEAVVYPRVVEEGLLYATVTEHRYYSIGSWERMELTKQFFDNKPTVFLDRDGTLNVRPPKACYIESPNEFIWLPGAIEAVGILKDAGFRIILVTNQPGIARGNIDEMTLRSIHDKMQRDLDESGVKGGIDDIIYCPHNWDDGCDCRKPRPGMLYQAQKKYSLNLTECFMIGDDDRDIEAGSAAGCKCIKVYEGYSLLHAVKDILNGDAIYK